MKDRLGEKLYCRLQTLAHLLNECRPDELVHLGIIFIKPAQLLDGGRKKNICWVQIVTVC